MSWLYSQALVEEYSEVRYSDGGPFVPWKLKNIHVGYSCSDRTTAASLLSRFGMILQPSGPITPNAAASLPTSDELQISWLFPAASHARISAWLERVKVSAANAAAYGEKCGGWFAKYDLPSSTWKTAQCSLLGELTEFSGSFPRWGIMLSGVCWELMTLALTTAEKEYGSWPTPCVADTFTGNLKSSQQKPGSLHSVTLAQKVQMFPTPTTQNAKKAGKGKKAQGGMNLQTHVQMFPTPAASDGKRGGTITKNMTGTSLTQVVNTMQKRMYPTPTANEDKYRLQGNSQQGNSLGAIVRKEAVAAGTGGQLNPDWVEWLMGWPMGWPELKPLETDRCLPAWPQHFLYSTISENI